jgi:transposase
MAKRYTDEFRRDAVRMATTSGLTRRQLSSDLGVGVFTLNKWVQQHPLPGRALRSNGPRGSTTI